MNRRSYNARKDARLGEQSPSAAPVDVLAVVAYALDQDERGAFGITKQEAAERIREARAAVAELIKAADFAAVELAKPGAPTRTEREEIIGRLRAALASVGGAA